MANAYGKVITRPWNGEVVDKGLGAERTITVVLAEGFSFIQPGPTCPSGERVRYFKTYAGAEHDTRAERIHMLTEASKAIFADFQARYGEKSETVTITAEKGFCSGSVRFASLADAPREGARPHVIVAFDEAPAAGESGGVYVSSGFDLPAMDDVPLPPIICEIPPVPSVVAKKWPTLAVDLEITCVLGSQNIGAPLTSAPVLAYRAELEKKLKQQFHDARVFEVVLRPGMSKVLALEVSPGGGEPKTLLPPHSPRLRQLQEDIGTIADEVMMSGDWNDTQDTAEH